MQFLGQFVLVLIFDHLRVNNILVLRVQELSSHAMDLIQEYFFHVWIDFHQVFEFLAGNDVFGQDFVVSIKFFEHILDEVFACLVR